jgi:hypothetical protein
MISVEAQDFSLASKQAELAAIRKALPSLMSQPEGLAYASEIQTKIFDNSSKFTKVELVDQTKENNKAKFNFLVSVNKEILKQDLNKLKLSSCNNLVDRFNESIYSIEKLESKDYPKKAKEYLKAAERGDARAQFNLAVLYVKGKGLNQNSA